MRIPKIVSLKEEMSLILKLGEILKKDGFNAENSAIITVSTDYSSMIGQILRHYLSHEGEICDGFGIDVPYPDEKWDWEYSSRLYKIFDAHKEILFQKKGNPYSLELKENKIPILVEAAVIRGGNYNFLVDWIQNSFKYKGKIITVALYENSKSKFKSNYVGSYYNDDENDLTFWWEKDNKHWK